MPLTENQARLHEELQQYLVGLRAIMADALPAVDHVGTAIIMFYDCSPALLDALEACGGRRVTEHEGACAYVDLRGARVSVRAVERASGAEPVSDQSLAQIEDEHAGRCGGSGKSMTMIPDVHGKVPCPSCGRRVAVSPRGIVARHQRRELRHG